MSINLTLATVRLPLSRRIPAPFMSGTRERVRVRFRTVVLLPSMTKRSYEGGRLRPCCTDRSLGGEDRTVYQGPVSDPGQPPCHSKRTKIAVITSRRSGPE